MKFNEYIYERPDIESVKKELETQLQLIGTNQPYEVELNAINSFFKTTDQINTLVTLVSIRNSLDTTDEFYEKEQAFFDENGPVLRQYDQMFFEKLLSSSHKDALKTEF